MSDFYPLDDVEGGDKRFPLTFDQLRLRVEEARLELAVARSSLALQNLAGRDDKDDDRDYNP